MEKLVCHELPQQSRASSWACSIQILARINPRQAQSKSYFFSMSRFLLLSSLTIFGCSSLKVFNLEPAEEELLEHKPRGDEVWIYREKFNTFLMCCSQMPGSQVLLCLPHWTFCPAASSLHNLLFSPAADHQQSWHLSGPLSPAFSSLSVHAFSCPPLVYRCW